MKLYSSILVLTLLSMFARAQNVSQGGRFSMADFKACAPYGNSGIVINAPECIEGGPFACSVDFDYDGTFGPNALLVLDGELITFPAGVTNPFTNPGTYTVMVQFGANAGFDQLTFTVLPNEAPTFDIYTCSSSRVQLNITDSQYDQYSIDYDNDNTTDDTSPPGMVPPHTYVAAGSQTINVRGNYVNCTPTSKTVTPVASFGPVNNSITQLQVQEDNSITLNLATDPNYLYQLDYSTNNTSFTEKQKVVDANIVSLTDVDADQNYYCFRMGAINICDSPTPLYTNTVCSADLNLDIQDGNNKLTWTTNTMGMSSLYLTKNPGTSPIALALSSSLYNDTDIRCGTNHCYQLVGDYGAGVRSLSKTVCGEAFSTAKPPVIENITSVVGPEAGVQLTWAIDPTFTIESYSVYKHPNQLTTPLATVNTPSFTDATYRPFEKMCYEVSYKDICGNESDRSTKVCPVELKALLDQSNIATLQWTAYTGWKSGVDHYVVEKYDATGNLISSTDVNTTSFIDTGSDPGQVFTYRVLAIATDGSVAPLPSVSNTQRIIKSVNLVHPTAFVPNSNLEDNRTFKVLGVREFIATYELKIFNRWGELMFHTTDPEVGWDGTYKGNKMPEGTYVFKSRVTDIAGRTLDYAGSVILLNKS